MTNAPMGPGKPRLPESAVWKDNATKLVRNQWLISLYLLGADCTQGKIGQGRFLRMKIKPYRYFSLSNEHL